MDYKCDQCTFRVGGGASGREMLENHIATAHPKVESAKPEWEAKKPDRVYGDAVPDVVKAEDE